MRRSMIYIACAILAAVCSFVVVPRQILQHQYRYLLGEKKGRLSVSDDAALRQAVVIATWRGASFSWKTSYWCDAQTIARPDASGAFTIPDVSRQVDVSTGWLSRLLGMEVDFSWDLFVYVPGQYPVPSDNERNFSAHAPWSLALLDTRSSEIRILPIGMRPTASNPREALDYYASYLRTLECKPNEAPELESVRREAGKEAFRLLCAVEDPSAVNRIFASKILARPVGLIALGPQQPADTIDLSAECEAVKAH